MAADDKVVNGEAIMPIGKYKGKRLETVVADREYCDWLKQQDWAREKFPHIIQFVINGERDNHETPEHNRIQAMFLKNEFRMGIAKCIGIIEPFHDRSGVVFEKHGYDAIVFIMAQAGDYNQNFKNSPDFKSQYSASYAVEIKPTISDDYPVIMRQVETARSILRYSNIVVYTEKITSKYLSERDIREMFMANDIIVVTREELELEMNTI